MNTHYNGAIIVFALLAMGFATGVLLSLLFMGVAQ